MSTLCCSLFLLALYCLWVDSVHTAGQNTANPAATKGTEVNARKKHRKMITLDPTLERCAEVMQLRRRFSDFSEFVSHLIREEWDRRVDSPELKEDIQAALNAINRHRKSAIEGQSKGAKERRERSSRSGATV